MGSKVYFDHIAGEWDKMRSGFFSDQVRIKAVEKAEVKSGHCAADIGAGTGFVSELLLQKGIKVTAVDQSSQMLQRLSQKLKGTGELDCRQGNSEDLPLETRSMDYVFANMFLHHVNYPDKAIAEMVRILKPGGRLLITDLDTHTFDFLVEEQKDRWMGFERSDIGKWYQQAGLTDVAVEGVNSSCCATSALCGDKADISIFLASGRKNEE